MNQSGEFDSSILEDAVRRRLILVGLFAGVLGYLVFALPHFLPPAPYGLADDWRVFYGAGSLIHQGGNPYSNLPLLGAEQQAQFYPFVQPALDQFSYLPVVGWLLVGVTALPFWVSYGIWTGLGLLGVGWASFAWLGTLGWRKRGLWLVAGMGMWITLLGFLSGQFDALLLVGLVGSLLYLKGGRPVLAGFCMVIVLFKPHLLWPLPLLLLAAWFPDWQRTWKFGVTTLAVLVLGGVGGFFLVPGAATYFSNLFNFAGAVSGGQPDLAGLPGLVLRFPAGEGLGLAIAGFGALVCLVLFLSAATEKLRLPAQYRHLIPLVGLAIWLASTPYDHPNDDILLLPLLAVVIGLEGNRLNPKGLAYGLVGAGSLIAAYLIWFPAGDLLVLVMAVGLIWKGREVIKNQVSAWALVALVVLPPVWPFHLSQVSLTPIAGILVALAGGVVLMEARFYPGITTRQN